LVGHENWDREGKADAKLKPRKISKSFLFASVSRRDHNNNGGDTRRFMNGV